MDVDSDGRVLAGTDESGSMQIIEISADGDISALTALPGACSGRYLPGARAILVSHDDGGNERAQISRLSLEARSAGEAPAGRAAGGRRP